MSNGIEVGDWASVAGLAVQGGFAFFLWYFVAKWMPKREAEYREDVKAFLQELALERQARERDQAAYMKSLTELREQSYRMRQEDRAATAEFFERLVNEFIARKETREQHHGG